MQKTGQVERTIDREFTDEEVKYKTFVVCLICELPPFNTYVYSYEKEVEKLQKEAKSYIDSMRGACHGSAPHDSTLMIHL